MNEFREIIDFYYQSNYGTFTEYMKTQSCELYFSDCIKDNYYNHAIHLSGGPKEIFETHFNDFEKRNREATIYITPLSPLYGKNLPKDFKKWASDAWMIADKNKFKNIKEIKSDIETYLIDEKDKKDYLDTFKNAFSNKDDVYGNVSDDYLVAENRFFEDKNGFKSNIFIAKQSDEPIGVIRTVTKNSLCFIYALAVIKEYRKKGEAAKVLGNIALKHAINSGIETFILQTEAGSILERLYSIRGFKRAFTGNYYTLSDY